MNYPKLYKRTATGATQVWWQEVVEDRYRTHSGQNGGQIVVSEWTVAQAKNVGRSNETTPETQARLEVDANYTLKRKKGYVDSLDIARSSERFQPMLAKNYPDYTEDVADHFSKHGWVIAQPKLDGIRCIATPDGLFSRNGNRIVAVPHIEEIVRPIFERDHSLILDGELYHHDLRADFPRIVSLVRKTKPSLEDLKEARQVQYWIYDMHLGQAPDTPTSERMRILENVAAEHPGLMATPTVPATSLAELGAIHASYLESEFEGTMLRLEAPYEQKRSKALLKWKEFQDDEFVVAAIHEGVGNRSGMAGYAELLLPDGRVFRANIKGDRAFLRKLLLEAGTYVGAQATVEFFHYTPDGIPRFPRIKAFHREGKW